MPTIKIAQEAGACWGVERALGLVEQALQHDGDAIYTLGPLIHNPQVVSSLEERGVQVCSTAELEEDSTIVLRTHGVTPELEQECHKRNLKVVDAVCPFVKKVHLAAKRLLDEGYQVLVVGEVGHPEVVATCAHAPGSLVVGSADELDALELSRKLGIVVQTTQSKKVLQDVVSAVVGKVDELRIMNTICEATGGHQSATAELAQEADVMVVIGGKNSANTTHLAEISAAICPKTYHIEKPSELKASYFEDAKIIGITAGASTPASQIEQTRAYIEQMVAL